ncbi:MAG: hypothetical protein AB1499_10675 [Nitrospirota bacterium]
MYRRTKSKYETINKEVRFVIEEIILDAPFYGRSKVPCDRPSGMTGYAVP